MTPEVVRLYTDGGARGNPGPAGAGFVLYRGSERVAEGARYLGEATNNQAEYAALIDGMKKVVALGERDVDVYMDSELIVNQMRRTYRVKDAALGKLFIQAWNIVQTLGRVTFSHIPREENAEADRLVNQAIDHGA
ncbi:MAG: ribonuclease HI family protein [Candidatus Kerfeldbacteria bacterium]|nr:ribonuclease HI family protein [Candidatus Kerfeldbacteria bacterium]